jgi:hypothetical protein
MGRGIAKLIAVIGVGIAATVLVAAPVHAAEVDYPSALTSRLAKEYGDPALAGEVVGGISADALTQLAARVPLADVATSPFLSYRPRRVPAREVDSVVVFAFGNRVGADGSVTSGPTNDALAVATQRFVKQHPVPVFAQQEIAQHLQAEGVKHVTSIDPQVGPDGKVVYLSTAGVADQIVQKAQAAGVDLGTVGVIGFADHVVRCVLTAEAAGMTAGVPKGVKLAHAYDPDSGQTWTRDRKSYLATDLIGRLATL